MINHARTLLLNQPRRRMHYADTGYAYIPTEFKTIKLPPTLLAVRQILFGSRPDNYFLNYRCRELLSYLHTTELAQYVYSLDPRVTYWPEISKPFFEPANKIINITQTYGEPARFSVAGELRALNSLGRAHNQYVVDWYKNTDPADETLKLKIKQVGDKSAADIETLFSFSDTPVLSLPDTDIKIRLKARQKDGAEDVANIIRSEDNALLVVERYSSANQGYIYAENAVEEIVYDGLIARWFIDTKSTPDPVLMSAVSALEMIGEPASIELFGLENKEPYLTFKNLWFDHPLPVYRLSGIVLALIYRTEELRG
ncbi:hypothetical protein EBZ39_04070 [bacterium]|nr:hypothetical protein [bacterium]